jgi:predicted TIM-barrel fold metal-dependent hydrolase
MRIVALEEHFTVPAVVRRIDPEAISRRGFRPRSVPKNAPSPLELLGEIGERRLAAMDAAGISVQVLSVSGPGPDLVPGPEGVAMAREMNDHLAAAVARHPDRLAGFAVLPMQRPEATADELSRAVKTLGFHGALVNGTTEGRFLDHPSYDQLLAAAVELDVPIYVHPHLPPQPVREAYYSDLPAGAGRVLESAGWGWHSETAIHLLRLVVSGRLDRHRRLKLIIGHMGEMLPMMLHRIDDVFALDIDHLERPVSRAILDQVWLTTSGVFVEPPFLAALLTFGIDRIMFSVDYPYASNASGRAFLDRLSLAPADMEKLGHGNADALLRLKGSERAPRGAAAEMTA